MQLPILGGGYAAQSIIANAQRAVNYFPEKNREDSPWPWTHYQRPGLKTLAQGPVAGWRGIYRASNGNAYGCVGNGIYFIAGNWALTKLGDLAIATGQQVRFIDNGLTIFIVDGSALGYSINMGTNAFAQITDPTGTFNGGSVNDIIDGFLVWNLPGTRQFGSTLFQTLTFDGLYTAGKVTYPDLLTSLIVNRHQLLLFGTLKSEIWFNAGGATFPFAQVPGAYIEHGCIAPYSVAAEDINVYWLGQDLQGQAVVFRQRGYDTTAISNPAVVGLIQAAIAGGQGVADAIGFCWQQRQHVFYQLTFPSANMTLVYDASIQDPNLAWHQQSWTDPVTQGLNRHRANCGAFLYNTNVVGDWSNGKLYAMDPNTYTDAVGATPGPISFIRGFPHVVSAPGPQGQAIFANGHQIQYKSFIADMECGNAPLDAQGNQALITLKYSDDRGKTFSGSAPLGAGAPGQWKTQPKWNNVGIARDRVFEIQHSIAGQAALNGGWIDVTALGN